MSCQCKPISWAELTPDKQQRIGNGCGPVWLPNWARKMVRCYLFGWMYESSCRRHDFAYVRGGSEADRKRADRGFYLAMVRDANRYADRAEFGKHVVAWLIAWCFYRLVRAFGWLHFYYGPYRSMEWFSMVSEKAW